jgi:hypothetical protein
VREALEAALLETYYRPELIRLIRERKFVVPGLGSGGGGFERRVDWKAFREFPSRWFPHTVIDPEAGIPFTDIGAWEFILKCLEEMVPLRKVSLKHPPGCWAVWFLGKCSPNLEDVYVKLQLHDHGKPTEIILGRSFHTNIN